MQVKTEPARGILHARPPAAPWGHTRYLPSAALASFVEHFWVVRWDVTTPETAETLPHPSIHLVLGAAGAEIVGVMRGRFTTTLAGTGRVVGTKFRPGAFRAFVERPVAELADRRWPAAVVLGRRAAGLAAAELASRDDGEVIAAVESCLLSYRPRVDEAMELAGRLVARIAADRAITRVQHLVAGSGLTVRRIQRLFRETVGASPKWVIERYRLIEAAERLVADPGVDGADLAHELGYADQAHFIRSFKRIVGRPPAAYARRLRGA